MARAARSRAWALALWAVCLVAAGAGHLVGPAGSAVPTDSSGASIGMLAPVTGAAVLPAIVAEEAPAATHGAPARLFFPLALLGALVTVAAGARWRPAAGGRTSRPLRARRHAIALRAPPLQFA